MSTGDFQRVNGFSNVYWGWGKEDDDLYQRVLLHNLTVTRPFQSQPFLAHQMHYRSLYHPQEEQNPKRGQLYEEWALRIHFDGLVDLSYRKLKMNLKPLYTHIIVDIQHQTKS